MSYFYFTIYLATNPNLRKPSKQSMDSRWHPMEGWSSKRRKLTMIIKQKVGHNHLCLNVLLTFIIVINHSAIISISLFRCWKGWCTWRGWSQKCKFLCISLPSTELGSIQKGSVQCVMLISLLPCWAEESKEENAWWSRWRYGCRTYNEIQR